MEYYSFVKKVLKPLLHVFFPSRFLDLPETLPEGPLVICANHLSNLDAVLLGVHLNRRITFMAKKEVFSVPFFGKRAKRLGTIPLTRDGGDAAGLRVAIRALQGGAALSIFPQGTRCHCPPEESTIKAGLGMLVSLSGAQVLPVGIHAKDYKVRLFRKTYFAFGTVQAYPLPDAATKREAMELLSARIFEDVIKEAHRAKDAKEKK